ncbi:MAG: methyltransferase domain-containing protein, partial [Armatimonadetes bacterium]|nr:methyltransferase domain-containing protein [Armatimonadota bacterium]
AAKQRLPEARLVQGDVRRLPFADNSFDACLSFGVIEHFPEGPDATLAEARRVLAPGGKVILSVPHVNWPSRIGNPLKVVYRWLRRLPCTEAPEPPGRYHGRAELRDAFERSGFEIVALLPFDHAYALHSFSGVFRRRDAYHDVTPVGYALARWLRRIAPWGTAFTACVVGRKR